MNKTHAVFSFLAGVTLAGVLYAAPAASVRVFVNVPPPPPLVEVRAVVPGPGFVWIGGYHRWNGTAYVWVPGRWARPPRAHGIWIPGHWKHAHRGWHWVDGHWR